MKVAEKEEQIAGMQRQIEELKRMQEQGSQQLQGEVLELELNHRSLPAASRWTSSNRSPRASSAMLLHRVVGPAGQPCGAILWESKRTKNWSQGWLGKLRGDQRAARADIALMVSEALPPGVESFDLLDGVYVAHPKCAIPIAILLRQSLIELANSRVAQEWPGYEDGASLWLSDRSTLPPPGRGDRGKVLGYAGGPRQGTQGHNTSVGQARGAESKG